jgi:hypothetical protein
MPQKNASHADAMLARAPQRRAAGFSPRGSTFHRVAIDKT